MKTMLVPLDGSQASEAVLPAAIAIAKASDYAITLLSVWEIPEGLPEFAGFGEETLRVQGVEYLRKYLRSVAAHVEDAGVVCEIDAASGHPAVEVLGAIGELKTDMVALSTHGRRAQAGRRGSTADKILRASSVPVLAVGPSAGLSGAGVAIRRVLVPLDGGAASESALALALGLAADQRAEVALLTVVPHLFEHYGPGVPENYLPEIDQRRRQEAELRLRTLQLQHPQVITETHVLPGLPQVEIPAFLERSPYDLVVMASRSRFARDLWTVGGVADVMIEGPTPVLIVPPAGE
ncbi:MAG: universal stress protein [Dehalococcoidia bacterium]|nr:universal stress protein [Dehalococcoidia bacterium]